MPLDRTMGKSKTELATEASVIEIQEKLDAVQAANSEKELQFEDVVAKLRREIQDLRKDLDDKLRSHELTTGGHAEELAKLHHQATETKDSVRQEGSRVSDLHETLATLQQQVTSVENLANLNYQSIQGIMDDNHQSVMAEIETAKAEVVQYTDEVTKTTSEQVSKTLTAKFESSVSQLRRDTTTNLDTLEKKLTASLRSNCDSLDEKLKGARSALETDCSKVSAEWQEHTQAMDARLQASISKVDREIREKAASDLRRAEEARNAQDAANATNFNRLEKDIQARCLELDSQDKKTREELQQQGRQVEERVAVVQEESKASIKVLEEENSRINSFCSGVAGIPIRQVEWHVVSQSVQQIEEDHRFQPSDSDKCLSYFSPPFEAASTRGMQLELRMEAKSASEVIGGDDQCSLYLWAAQGLQLVFRLFFGSESVILRHTFDGKTPCGIRRMGKIAESKLPDGSIRLGIEIHESLVESTAFGDKGTSNPMSLTVSERDGVHQPVHGVLSVQRYLNHRLLELMQSQQRGLLDQLQKKVDQVRSRATRKVQWRLENAPLLRQSFAEGQAVRSTAFQAGGISGLQLVFYPQGYAGARSGFCSVFLSCPPGCTVRCWLWAGRWRREAKAEPADKPDMIGRINFCRFENCVDPMDESVELALEIEQAQQATRSGLQAVNRGTSHHEASEMEASSSAQLGESTMSAATESDTPLERADLAISRVQHDLSTKPGPDGVQLLPAIWTTQGFHTFENIEEKSTEGQSAGPGSRAQTAGSTKQRLSPPATPRLPQTGTGSRKSTPRKGPGKPGIGSSIKEYSRVGNSLPQPSY